MDSKEQMWNMFGTKMTMLLVLILFWVSLVSSEVTYDRKAIIINGKRRILISGSIHYPRSTPEMWPDLINKAKQGGVEVIQTYVFWDGHEPSQGQYYFGDRYDIVRFIKLVHQAGLYVNLRIGPYICGEWNFGGFPVWLKFVPGISFRTDNKPFEDAMQKFTTVIVDMMKSEKLFEWQGGPIILAQIENEYGPTEWEIKAPGERYRNWAASMALNQKVGVPWIMCKQDHAPNPIITTCNGFYCHDFKPDKDWTPKMWTELWTGWYTEFGGSVPYRPVQDVAFGVARFIQNGGSYINYYMYHGGTNFGRTAGGPMIGTSYDYDAPLDEYGWVRQPKWGHLRDLHNAIKQSELALVSADANVTWLGKNQEAHVYSSPWHCAAFLANYDTKYWVRVKFWNGQYDLPPWSISILPDCKTEVFNTAKVNEKGYFPSMVPAYSGFSWQSSKEWIREAYGKDMFTRDGLYEQLSLTWDKTDYLWYTTEITLGANDLKSGQSPELSVMSAGHALLVFVNGQLVGKAYGTLNTPSLTFTSQVKLNVGVNKLSLLSTAVGLANVGLHFETWNVGVLGPVTLKGLNSGAWDLSKWKWSYKVGLDGETKNIYSEGGTGSVGWVQGYSLQKYQPLTWYKTYFNAPGGYGPLALDMGSMGKGQMWINGRSIGRHWPAYHARGNCNDRCDYAGWYDEFKCRTGCGQPSQRWYHVPRSWLKATGNLLVVLEEWGGDPTKITLVERK